MSESFYKLGGVSGLGTGRAHRILVFDKNPTCPVPAAAFAFGSAFPAPGVRLHLELVQRAITKSPGAQMVVFGHADSKGSVAANKAVSDRRARAVLALMLHDVPAFAAVADEERWGELQEQAMLRALGCNPGPIDGQSGPLTRSATRAFQRDWNEGVFGDASPVLDVDGEIGPETRAALLRAYVLSMPLCEAPTVSSGSAGCASFNAPYAKDEQNRRAVVALITNPLPRATDFPCKAGDASACPVDGVGPNTCPFYREHVGEKTSGLPPSPDFFDFQWFPERKKKGDDSETVVAHLSALTTLPDGTKATFTIHRCEHGVPRPAPQSWKGDAKPTPGAVLGTATGQVHGGVCFARWECPQDFDPFALEDWVVAQDPPFEENDDDGRGLGAGEISGDFHGRNAIQPPVYGIDAGGKWGFSAPPGRRVNTLRFAPTADGVRTGGAPRVHAVLDDGGVLSFAADRARDLPDDVAAIHLQLDEAPYTADPDAVEPGSTGAAA